MSRNNECTMYQLMIIEHLKENVKSTKTEIVQGVEIRQDFKHDITESMNELVAMGHVVKTVKKHRPAYMLAK